MKSNTLLTKLTSFIIFFAVISSLLLVPAHAQEVQGSADNGKASYEFLKAVGILAEDDPVYSSDEPVSRAYFVKLALQLSNDAPNVLVSDDEVFFDVNPDTQYEAYIETAYRIGYISGGLGGYFNPQNTISYGEALKILVNILGYTPFAEAGGGYPTGYIKQANDVGISNYIEIAPGGLLTQSVAMQLLENSAKTDLMEVYSMGDSTEYRALKGETLLTQRHKIQSMTALIQSNCYTDLVAENPGLEKGQIRAGGMVLSSGNSGAEDYLGYEAEIYYDTQSDKKAPTVLYVKKTEANTVWECQDSADIEISGDYINLLIDENNINRISLKKNVTYIVNGKMAYYDKSMLPEVYGSVIFLSNDGDKTADVVLIKDFDLYIVSGASAVSRTVTAKDGSKIELDPESDEYDFEIYNPGGTKADFDAIKSETVILMAQSNGEGICKKELVISNEQLNGVISEKGEDYVVINSVSYKILPEYLEKITLGANYKCLVDARGKISYVNVKNDIVYGYLYAAAKSENGLNSKVMCRIFTENNRWVELEFKDKFKFNGQTINAADVLGSGYLGNTTSQQRQMIRYNVNEDAQIIKMETAVSIPIDSPEEAQAIENDTFRISYKPSQEVAYRSNSKTLDGNVFVDSATKLFVIPSNNNEDDFSVITSLSSNREYPNLVVYDADENMVARVLSTSYVSNGIPSSTKFMIVKSKGTMLNSEDDAVTSIRGLWNGGETAFPVKICSTLTQSKVDAVKPGDIIRFAYDDNGDIFRITNYASVNSIPYYKPSTMYQSMNIIGGVADSVDYTGNRIKLYYNSSNDRCAVSVSTSASVSIYDSASETVKKASFADVTKEDKIILRMSYFVAQEILIIR